MKLQELLAKIGMPLQQSRQSYQYITPVLRNHLKSQLENETIQNDYNLVQPGIIFRSNSCYHHHHHHLCHHHDHLYTIAFHHFICHHHLSYHYRTFNVLPIISACMHLIYHLSCTYHLSCIFI